VSGQLQIVATQTHLEQEAGWAHQPVWMLRNREKSIFLAVDLILFPWSFSK
jgi:hypothetical protein